MDQTVYKKVSAFFSRFPERVYPQGHILIFNGEETEYIYSIVKGRVSQYDISYKGDEIVVHMFQPPAFFPASLALTGSPSEYFYKCDAETVVRCAPPLEVAQFLQGNPDVALDLLTRVYRGTDSILKRMVHLMAGSAAERLMYEIITECRRFGKMDGRGVYVLDTNEAQLASQTGLTRETVNREIKKLKARGMLEVERNRMRVLDLLKLEDFLESIT